MPEETSELLETKSITTFDDLPPELILYIFEYLSMTDRYKSFFDYDTRLRQLVKRWTTYSREALNADIKKLSTDHSCYKHLSFENGGTEFIVAPEGSERRRYPINPQTIDTSSFHWSFHMTKHQIQIPDERIRKILFRHTFRLNPFFYHQPGIASTKQHDKKHQRSFYDGDIIFSKRHSNYFEPWIQRNYLEVADEIFKNPQTIVEKALMPVGEAEWLKANRIIQKEVDQVWEELRSLEDFNPLKIQYTYEFLNKWNF
ncbi:unnamed protein product [Rotaria socialis]|uniref:F-box domain-containing protein n=1 Tax=Rotaria socialis TaxID=392032 RepID=A0A817WKD3_9BILA|nr:unnamed protein product [Rotaria socialis]CAF3377702.1 unnamed protein product [Rotaria socialis]CAF4360358.1 unnamed protein product [Rotaria socialis]CAF4491285.1 unnamed protein product [Rotaria socialis]